MSRSSAADAVAKRDATADRLQAITFDLAAYRMFRERY